MCGWFRLAIACASRSKRSLKGARPFLIGDDAVEPGIERLVHLSHAADANGRDDFVGTEPGTGGEEHE